MLTYTVEELKRSSYVYTGLSFPAISQDVIVGVAKQLNIKIGHLRAFRFAEFEWGIFKNTEFVLPYDASDEPVMFVNGTCQLESA